MRRFNKNFMLGAVIAVMAFSGLAQAQVFPDVAIDNDNYLAIEYVNQYGSMTGYADGTFRPNKALNRAELVKVVFAASSIEDGFGGDSDGEEQVTEPDAEQCFADVPEDAWFAEAVCIAKAENIIGGYEDGTFKPDQKVSVVEAAKIIALAKGIEVSEGGDFWYSPYLRALGNEGVLPESFEYANQEVSRGELAEMMWRLSGAESAADPSLLSRANVAEIEGSTCSPSPEDMPENIDMDRVRETWLGWNNDTRAGLGLAGYEYEPQLGRTAAIWSERAENLGYISHTRPGSSAYYDYSLIGRWFADLGVEFERSGGRSDYVENIAWEYYSCNDGECTDELIAGIRKSYDFFVGEKGRAYSPHYDSIVSPNYKYLGLGIAVDETANGGKFYLTVHYGTEITSDPDPICP
ncbi:MAG: S-layer homology domain-containing protein [Candidatus Gracilibacteria bacterium]